jgi:hypothetical protein
MDIISHELNAYEREINALNQELESLRDKNQTENLTHLNLAISNRGHLIIIGLCSLIEVHLYDIAVDEEKKHIFKLHDLNQKGLARLQKYLSVTKRIDFGKIKNWDKFKNIWTLRNVILHSYGGLIVLSDLDKVKKTLENLKIGDALILDKRIRIPLNKLYELHSIVADVIKRIK